MSTACFASGAHAEREEAVCVVRPVRCRGKLVRPRGRRGDHRSPANFGFGVHSERAQIVRSSRYGSAAKRCAVAALTGKSNFIGEGELHRKLCLPPGGRWHAKRDGRRMRGVGFMFASFPQVLVPHHTALSLSHGKAVTATSRREPWFEPILCFTQVTLLFTKAAGDRWSPLRWKACPVVR